MRQIPFFLMLIFITIAILMAGCKNDQLVRGPQGVQGDPGLTGPAGSTGASGGQGTSGSTPVLTTQPAGSLACQNGGLVIESDSAPIGVICNGLNGAAGINISPVSIVQFCPGTTVYPSQFNEVGFCISGNLYGTYSANDGFSSYLPPGTYSSNGINSSCTFTIGPNCQVSNQ